MLVFTLGSKQNRGEQPLHFHLKRSPSVKISLPTRGQEAYSRLNCLGPRLEAWDNASCWCLCCRCSVAKPCPILCNPMDCSTPGPSVLCYFRAFAQIHEMATHSSILAWKTPWMEKPDGLQSMESQRVGHDWVTSLCLSEGIRERVWHIITSEYVLITLFFCVWRRK